MIIDVYLGERTKYEVSKEWMEEHQLLSDEELVEQLEQDVADGVENVEKVYGNASCLEVWYAQTNY